MAFGRRCTTAGAGAPVAPPPPPAAAVYYAEGTLTLTNANIGSTTKTQNRFKQNLRADVSDALGLDQEQLLITALSPSSVTIEIFGDQGEVQAATGQLSSQLADPNSILLQGSVSSHITPNQRPNMPAMVMGGAGGGAGAAGELKVRVDDRGEVYFNGNQMGAVDGWDQVNTFPITAPCGGAPNVLAIHGVDGFGAAAILASWNHCGSTTKTDLGCKCTGDDVSAEDWTSATYDDSAWPVASDGGINGADPWGVTSEIDLGARWIWASDLQGTDEAYCRCTEGHLSNGDATGLGQFHIRVDDTSTICAPHNDLAPKA